MKAVIQRVLSASVAVDGTTISAIKKGLMVLIGVDRHDTPADATTIIKKILSARLFDDEEGNLWRKSVKDINAEILCVSQFTLLAGFKGSAPDFREAMSTIPGKAAYDAFMQEIRAGYDTEKIQEGRFGAFMAVSLVNDGPTTILLNSRETRSSSSNTPSGASTPALSAEAIKKQEYAAAKAAKKALFEANEARNKAKKEEALKQWEAAGRPEGGVGGKSRKGKSEATEKKQADGAVPTGGATEGNASAAAQQEEKELSSAVEGLKVGDA